MSKISKFWKFWWSPQQLPPDFLSGGLFHKPKFFGLSWFLICVEYELRIQNVYTLPMSGSLLLGAIWAWNDFFCPILPKIRLFLTPGVFKKGPKWNQKGSKWDYFIILWSKWYRKQVRSKNIHLKVAFCNFDSDFFIMSIFFRIFGEK